MIHVLFNRRNVLKLKSAVCTYSGGIDWRIGGNEWRRGREEGKEEGTGEILQ
jgi:hypothetical protein